jgi:hypothetical protein
MGTLPEEIQEIVMPIMAQSLKTEVFTKWLELGLH